MRSAGRHAPQPSAPWRLVRWSALVAFLLVAALLAAHVGANFVAGGHVAVFPHTHFTSTIALSAPPAASAHGLAAVPTGAG